MTESRILKKNFIKRSNGGPLHHETFGKAVDPLQRAQMGGTGADVAQ